MLGVGVVFGAAIPMLAWLLFDLARQEVKRYVEGEVRDAKQDLREWVREREQ